jgi:hypothetical protein
MNKYFKKRTNSSEKLQPRIVNPRLLQIKPMGTQIKTGKVTTMLKLV